MNKTIVARLLRLLLVACFVAVVFPVVVGGLGVVLNPSDAAVLLPFVAAGLSVAALGLVLAVVDRMVQRLAHDSTATPYSVLAETAARIRAGSLDEALPGLARVLGEGTGATHAELWLAVREKLVSVARYPADASPHGGTRQVDSLALLLGRQDTDYVVPVLDGSVLRAVLAIGKPGRPVTPADQQLMQDVANGAGLLLRGVALNAELSERVRRADELAGELAASRERLTQARDVQRRQLVSELGNATTDRLAALRSTIAEAGEALADAVTDPDADDDTEIEMAKDAIHRARLGLDELLDRFRVIARGVYPAVLRDQGPYGALEEVATDLPRPIQLSGSLPGRLAWEVESGIYYLAASAIRQLGGRTADRPLRVHLANADGQLSVRIVDPSPATSVDELRVALEGDVDRLAALGGALELTEDRTGATELFAWLPEQLAPTVDLLSQTTPVGAVPATPLRRAGVS